MQSANLRSTVYHLACSAADLECVQQGQGVQPPLELDICATRQHNLGQRCVISGSQASSLKATVKGGQQLVEPLLAPSLVLPLRHAGIHLQQCRQHWVTSIRRFAGYQMPCWSPPLLLLFGMPLVDVA